MSKRYNWAVGRRAEKLVQSMMEELGFTVVQFGYEYLLPEFANKKKLLKGPAGKVVRSQPDFLIVDPNDNYTYFIEVKYRKHGKISEKSIGAYPENYIVLVSPTGVLIARWKDIIENKDEQCFKLLTKMGPFKNKDTTIIMKYVELIKKSFY